MAALATKPLTESMECDTLVRSTSAGDEEGLSSDASHWSFESDRTCASHDIASISGIDDG